MYFDENTIKIARMFAHVPLRSLKRLCSTLVLLAIGLCSYAQPIITGISALSGTVGSQITITGTGFNSTSASNSVFFGAVKAGNVVATGTTMLTVTVPSGANYQYISITNQANGLTAYSVAPFVVTFPSNGTTDFTRDATVAVSAADLTYRMALGDLNGDGKPDLVVIDNNAGTHNILSNTDLGNSNVYVFLNTTTASGAISYVLNRTLTLPFNNGPRWGYIGFSDGYSSRDGATDGANNVAGVAIKDMDGDGKPDIAITFKNERIEGIATATNSYSGYCGDIRISIRSYTTYKLAAFVNTTTNGSSNLTFGSASLATFEGATDGAHPTADRTYGWFNGGASCDYFNGNRGDGTHLFIGTWYNYTGNPTYYPYGRNITLADFDGDGKVDVAIAKELTSTISVYRNTSTSGTISFGTSVAFALSTTSTSAYDLAAGDFDSDGKPDIAVANNGANTVSVLKNNSISGTLSFAVATVLTTGTNPQAIALGDFNNDSLLDIAVANAGSANLSLFLNTNATPNVISFPSVASLTLATGTTPFGLAIADMDGDGNVDIAVNNTGSSTAQVFKNNTIGSSLSFTNRVNYAVSSAPQGIAVGDMNGDGKPDMVVSGGTTSLSFLRNLATLSAPVISSVSALSGPLNNLVTITGQNFSQTGNNTVFFGTSSAMVQAGGTSTSITVQVPVGASYQYITVTNLDARLTGYSTVPFAVTYSSAAGTLNQLASATNLSAGSDPRQHVVKDFNGDNKPDIAVVNYTGQTILLFTNTSPAVGSSISFTMQTISLSGVGSTALATDDFDGDGKPDLAVYITDGSTLRVYKNVSTIGGSVSFTNTGLSLATLATSYAVAVGDFDLDGRPDIVVAGSTGSTLNVFRNTSTSGTIIFNSAQAVSVASTNFIYNLAIGDIDGDGMPDIVTANDNANNISILRNTSTGPGSITFAAAYSFVGGVGGSSVALALGDLNNDGKLDIALGSQALNTLTILRNITPAAGTINASSFAAAITMSITSPRSIAIGDIDGDGVPDVSVVSYATAIVSVYKNTTTLSSTLTFATRADYSTNGTNNNPVSAITMADLNQDGRLDVVTTNRDSNTLSVFRNIQIAPLQVTSFTPTSGPINTSVVITGANFNTTASRNVVFFGATQAVVTGSSSTSLTVTAPYGANYQYISITNLDMNATGYTKVPFVVTYTPMGDNGFRPGISLSTAVNTGKIRLSDLNNDGKPDVIVANTNNTFSVFVNQIASSTATATFGSAITVGTAGGAVSSSLRIADLDGDGLRDIAFVNGVSSTVSIYRNTTTGVGANPSFAAVATFTTAANPLDIVIADIDGDGLLDIVTANGSANAVAVLLNQSVSGTLGFGTQQSFTTGTTPSSIAVGDFNKDGKIDIAVANRGASTISVFRNASQVGSLSLVASTLTAGATPNAIVIGDFNGDTLLDIATTNAGSNNVSVLVNNTSISTTLSFVAKVDFSTGASTTPGSLVAGDTDGDGKVDLMTANLGNSTASVLRNVSTVGTLSFTLLPNVATASIGSPNSVALGDINADSKPDFVVTLGGTTNNIAVFIQKAGQLLTISLAATSSVDAAVNAGISSSIDPSLIGSVSYSIIAGSGSATIDALGNFTAVSAGTVTVTVYAAGSTDYASAFISQLITIGQGTPTLTFTSLSTTVVGNTLTATVTTTATLGRGGAITYSVTAGSGSATINPNTGVITGFRAGTVTVTVSSAGDTNYYGTTASQLVTIGTGTPTLVFVSPLTMTVDQVQMSVISTSAIGGGALTFSKQNGTPGSVDLNPVTGQIKAIQAGAVTITVVSAATSDYFAMSASQLVIILKGTPTLTILSSNSMIMDGSLTTSISTTATYGRGGAITLGVIAGSGSATINLSTGVIKPVQAGSIILVVSSAGDADYNPVTVSQGIVIGANNQTIAITSPSTMRAGRSLTATVSTTATGGQGGTYTYSISAGSGSATVDANTGLITAFNIGTVTLTVTSSGNTNYAGASYSQLITITQGAQTLTITSANTINSGATLSASATTTALAGGGGAITFTITAGSGSATLDQNTGIITGINIGTVTLTAYAAGDMNYAPASVSQLLTIARGAQTLTITSANMLLVGDSLTATAITTASSGQGGAITFSIMLGSGSATVNANTGLIFASGAGNVTLMAHAAGDTNYAPATTTQLLTIGANTPTITITSASTMTVDSTMQVTAESTALHGSTFSYSIQNDSGGAFVSPSGLITPFQSGTITVTVTSVATADYYAASASQQITIMKGVPVLTITSPNMISMGSSLTASVSTTATYDRGGAITFYITAGSGSATVDQNTGVIYPVSLGTVTLTATSAGDADYVSATTSQLISVVGFSQTLSIISANTLQVDEALAITVTRNVGMGQGGALSYEIQAGSGSATVDTNTGVVTGMSVGTVTLTVSAAGDGSFGPASASQLLTISQTTPTFNISLGGSLEVDSSLSVTITGPASHDIGVLTYSVQNGTGSAIIDSSGTIVAVSAGTITVTISSAGNADYAPTSIDFLVIIGQSTPTLSFVSSDTLAFGESMTAMVNTTATYGRGGAITFSITAGSGSATIDEYTGLVTAIDIGTVFLTASSTGDVDYYASTTTQMLTIGLAVPVLTITSDDTLRVGDTLMATVTTTAMAGQGGAITFSITAGSGSATVDENTGLITAISTGDVTLTASSAGDSDYGPASVSQVITIIPAVSTPTLTITSANNVSIGGNLMAAVSSTAPLGQGGAITFSIEAGSGSATVDENTGLVMGVSSGTVTLYAASAGDTNYYPAITSQIIAVSAMSISNSLTVAEGTTGYFVLSLTPSYATLSYDETFTISLNVNNQASPGHYILPSSAVFLAGQNSLSIPVQALTDTILYNDELLVVDIYNPTFGTFTASITITDASASQPITITIGDAFIYRSQTVSVTISLPAGVTSDSPIEVALGVASNSVLNLSSYDIPSSVIIPVGSNSVTFNVTASSTSSDISTLVIGGFVIDPIASTYVIQPGVVTVVGQDITVMQAFSPNGDGQNDDYMINGITDFPDNKVVIFDLGGRLVYDAVGYNNGSVTFKGFDFSSIPLEGGTYFVYITYYNQGRPYKVVQFLELRR